MKVNLGWLYLIRRKYLKYAARVAGGLLAFCGGRGGVSNG